MPVPRSEPDLKPGDSIVLNDTSGNIVMQYFRDRADKPCSIENNILCTLLESKVYHHNKHPTEQKFPEMTTRFREIIEEMYQTFLKKNNDYSRWNILATGIVGITTRFWDKTARIMNLVGFNIGTGEYTGPKENMVADERIEQTFLDASVYGIIARIYIEGKWGK